MCLKQTNKKPPSSYYLLWLQDYIHYIYIQYTCHVHMYSNNVCNCFNTWSNMAFKKICFAFVFMQRGNLLIPVNNHQELYAITFKLRIKEWKKVALYFLSRGYMCMSQKNHRSSWPERNPLKERVSKPCILTLSPSEGQSLLYSLPSITNWRWCIMEIYQNLKLPGLVKLI